MSQFTAEKVLDAISFTYIGGPSKDLRHIDMATEKQPFLGILFIGQDNQYSEYVRARPVE